MGQVASGGSKLFRVLRNEQVEDEEEVSAMAGTMD